MIRAASGPRFEMIVGVHDLADPPAAEGAERLSWMPFREVAPLLARILDETGRAGAPLHVTSDDAFLSDYALLAPWLLDHGLVGTFFIPTDVLDRPGRMTRAHLRELVSLGMRIGAHGHRHINWTEVGEAEFLADSRGGRDRLEQLIGAPVDRVAPPFGGFNGKILASLFRQGFREIYTCRPGLALAREPLKPRNMFKASAVASILRTAARRGGPWDAARCRLRRMRALAPTWVLPA